MLDLLAQLYAHDSFRFSMWDAFASLGIADTLVSLIHLAGWKIFEDWSIAR